MQTPAKRQASPTSPPMPRSKRGLNNLGNTCFMNSSLQCLVHTVGLSSYFLSDRFRQDINTTNPLGQQGEISIRYAEVVKELWADSSLGFAPRNFKYTIGKMNQTFEGYGQQDSHELLQTLLDGLHEDLNRIEVKKYQEDPEMGDLSEDEFAKISWESYLKRNDSIIVDLFQGQLKSRTVCQVCEKVSIKFDPYMYLQLPIPEPKTANFTIMALAKQATGHGFVNHKLTVPRHASIDQVKEIVAKQLGWSNPIVCVELFSHKVYKTLSFETVSGIAPTDVIAFYESEELDKTIDTLENSAPHYINVRFSTDRGSYSLGDFGNPFFITVPEEVEMESNEKINQLGVKCYGLLVAAITRFSKLPLYRRVGSGILMKPIAEHFHPNNQNMDRPDLPYNEQDLGYQMKDGFEPIPDLFEVLLTESQGYSRDERKIYPPNLDSDSSQELAAPTAEGNVPNLVDSDQPPPYHNTGGQVTNTALTKPTYRFTKDSGILLLWDKVIADFVFGPVESRTYKSANYTGFEVLDSNCRP